MQIRAWLVIALAIVAVSPSYLAGSEELNKRLKRIFDSPAFAGKRFGPARWTHGGATFTTLEEGPDIVEYDTATGKRSILVSHTQLTPAKAEKPLQIDDYIWDKEAKRLLSTRSRARCGGRIREGITGCSTARPER